MSFRELRSGPFNRKLREIAGEKSDRTEILGKKCPKICVNLARLFPFAPFVTENFWNLDRRGLSIVSCYCSNQLHPVKWSTVKEKCLKKVEGLLTPFPLSTKCLPTRLTQFCSCLSPFVSTRVKIKLMASFAGWRGFGFYQPTKNPPSPLLAK